MYDTCVPTFERHIIAHLQCRRVKEQIPSKLLYKYIKIHGVMSNTNGCLSLHDDKNVELKILNLKHKLSMQVNEH